MEKLLRHYYRIWAKIWHRLLVMERKVEPFDLTLGQGEAHSFIPLTEKSGHTNIMFNNNGEISSNRDQEWDDLQDRILRVLTYKYFDNDIIVIYCNKNFVAADTVSIQCFDDEMEMENQELNNYDENNVLNENDINYAVLPRTQEPEVIFIKKKSLLGRFWRRLKSAVTLRKCRRRRR